MRIHHGKILGMGRKRWWRLELMDVGCGLSRRLHAKRAYRTTQQHLSTPTMPADGLPEFRNSEGNRGALLEGSGVEKVLQRFNESVAAELLLARTDFEE